MNKIPITQEGLERLREELNRLETVDRPLNIKAIAEARGHGDLNENAEYHAAKERQGFIEGKINELKEILGRAEVIATEGGPTDRVVFGRTVVLYDLRTEETVSYQLVGPYESAPENGKISIESPLGRGLIGRSVGEEVKIRIPRGVQEYEILEIR